MATAIIPSRPLPAQPAIALPYAPARPASPPLPTSAHAAIRRARTACNRMWAEGANGNATWHAAAIADVLADLQPALQGHLPAAARQRLELICAQLRHLALDGVHRLSRADLINRYAVFAMRLALVAEHDEGNR